MKTDLVAYVDGASRGNPGPAGIGVVIADGEGNVLKEIAEPVGRTTNNVAEYRALIRALEEVRGMGGEGVQVYTDSELLARQINGQYQVRKRHLLPLFTRAKDLLEQFDRAHVTHVYREMNTHADRLSNLGADKVEARG